MKNILISRKVSRPTVAGQIVVGLALIVLMSTSVSAEEPAMKDIRRGIERAKRMKDEIVLPEKSNDEKVKKAAERASKVFHSEEFQRQVELVKTKLQREKFSEADSIGKGEEENRNHLSSGERIYLFISSSIPQATLRRYITTLEKIADPNIAVVMRGFIDGMEKAEPTLDFIRGVIYRDEGCDFKTIQCKMFSTGVNIYPLLFRRYKIERVPAVVFATGVRVLQPEMSEGLRETVEVGKSYTVYGDASLDYLLEQINKEAKSRSLEHMIAKLREGFFDER